MFRISARKLIGWGVGRKNTVALGTEEERC